MTAKRQILFTAILVLSINSLFAQSADTLSLSDQYQKMLKDHANWEIYKVIPVEKLNAFGTNLQDTIATKNAVIKELENGKSAAENEIEGLKQQAVVLEEKLSSAQSSVDEISFLGIAFTKGGYHAFVWVIIGLLIALVIGINFMYMRANKLTKTAQKDYDQTKNELEKYKDQAREKEVKLKRELQTAMNKLHENGLS